MESVSLDPVPNQSVAFNADGAFWQIHVFQSINFMCADVLINGVPIISGVRCFAGSPLLPYGYQTTPNFGNLIFDTDVDWNGFGTTCNLFFLEQDEVKQFQLLLILGAQTEPS